MEGTSLLVSDLDGTLLGDDDALGRFADWYRAHGQKLRLAYNSGRFFQDVRDLVRVTDLPEPDAVIGGVGTEIRLYPGGEPVDGWPRLLRPWDREGIRALLAPNEQLELQPQQFQTEFKISYYAHDLSRRVLVQLRRRLAMAGHCAEIVYSSGRDLDVLPAGVNKGSAAGLLASRWGLRPWQVIVSGDTGNDASMFLCGFRGIIVQNAQPELKAIRSPDVYPSDQAYAAGVLDGIRYWMRQSHDEAQKLP